MSIQRRPGIAALAAWLVLLSSTLVAQPSAPKSPSWWYGGYAGINGNVFGGQLRDFDEHWTSVAAGQGFTSGSGFGLALGGAIRYIPDGLFGGILQLGYDNRSIDLAEVTTTGPVLKDARWNGALSLSYLSLEPSLRFALPEIPVHVFAGPNVSVNLARSYEYSMVSSTGAAIDTAGDLASVRSLVLGVQTGVGYDIPLGVLFGSQAVATPSLTARFGQGPLDPPEGGRNDFSVTSVRLGVQLTFGSIPRTQQELAGGGGGELDYALRVPRHITNTRRVNETFPMRADVFFDEASAEIPQKYVKLTPQQAMSFHEEQLADPGTLTGGSQAVGRRERRQMQVYYEALNIIGDRLRANPTAKIQLVGAANGNAARGLEMARAVRDYLVNTFGISTDRISVDGQPLPPSRSGSGASARGESATMIAAENTRVTVLGPEEILRPVKIVSMQEEPLDNDVVFTMAPDSSIMFWSVNVEGSDGTQQTFGPFKGSIGRVPGKQLLAGRDAGDFNASIITTTTDGESQTSSPRAFKLQRGADDEVETAERYSILFEFDESKTVATYEKFLMETVAPAIPHASVVVVHGHTDIIGDEDYNAKLSQRRAEETQKVLAKELQKRGAYVTFDTYGFGEDERRAPFDNTAPEHRYYNRTVVIEVVQGE